MQARAGSPAVSAWAHPLQPRFRSWRRTGPPGSTPPLAAARCNPWRSCFRNAGRPVGDTLLVSAAPLHNADGEVLGCVITMADYTDRKAAEEALKQADRRKDEFLATLSHELRNPLAPVRNAVNIMKLRSPDEPELIWAREIIERQVHQLTRLIDDLLDVSRITRDHLELRKERVELSRILQEAVEISGPLIDQEGHHLALTLPGEPVHLDGDTRLAQIFSNLLNNAARYTPSGGSIELSTRHEDGHVVISVRDNGVGIPPDMLKQVFDMFLQVDASTSRSRGGLGIGLTLVKRLVHLHDGTVEARSDGLGRGSEFWCDSPSSVSSAPLPSPPSGPTGRRR